MVDCLGDFLAGEEGCAGYCDYISPPSRGRRGAGGAGDAELRRVLEVPRAVGDDLDSVTGGLRGYARGGDGPGVGSRVGDAVGDAAVGEDVGGGALEEEDGDGGVAGRWLQKNVS